MSRKQIYKVLSIDGGGIKGLYSAAVLEVFETHFKCKIADSFDMICGTSTGGIIAAALAIGIPAKDIVTFYKNEGPIIFPYKTTFSRGVAFAKQLLFKSKYHNEQLRNSLDKVFSGKKMSDTKVVLCIPTFNLTHGIPMVIKNDHANCYSRDDGHYLTDVLLATSAAPGYFPAFQFSSMSDDHFVDGGLWANNPSLVGIIEAVKHYVNDQGGYARYCLLSVGSVETPFGYTPAKERLSLREWAWKNRIIDTIFQAQSKTVENFILHLNNHLPGEVVRIKHPAIPNEKLKKIELDNASEPVLSYLESLGKNVGYNEAQKEKVINFFSKEEGN